MNNTLFQKVLVSISILALFASCSKVEDIPQQYLRSGNSLIVARDGNLIIAGYNSSSSKGYEATLIKSNPYNGDTIWSKQYGGSYSDAFYSVSEIKGGGYVATGFSNQSSSSSPKMYVVITDEKGTPVKSNTYGGGAISMGLCVLPHNHADSGYLVTGYIQKSGQADRDIYLVRLNNDGSVLWEKSYGAKSKTQSDTLNDAAYKIIAAQDGGYFITGSMNGYSSCCGKIFLMKVSYKGDSLWTKTYDKGIGSSLILAQDGNLAIGGSIQEAANSDFVLIKTDTSGKYIDKYVHPLTGFEYGSSMVETKEGFVMTGITTSKGAGADDVYLLKISKSLDYIWEKPYGGSDIDQGYGIVQLQEGDFCITGLSNTGGSYIFLNRVNQAGEQAANWPTPRYYFK